MLPNKFSYTTFVNRKMYVLICSKSHRFSQLYSGVNHPPPPIGWMVGTPLLLAGR